MVPESSQLILAPLNPYLSVTEEREPLKFGVNPVRTLMRQLAENCGATGGRNLQRKQKLLKHHSQRVSRMQRSMQASERAVSTWFTSIPMTTYGFQLNKMLCLRYGWTPERLPSHCPCGEVFSVASTVRKDPCLQSGITHSSASVVRELSFEVY